MTTLKRLKLRQKVNSLNFKNLKIFSNYIKIFKTKINFYNQFYYQDFFNNNNKITNLLIDEKKELDEISSYINLNIPFSLEQLLIIKAIVICGSFKNAADNLYMSQPSISLQLKKLETRLNVSLFERNQKTLKLTFYGQLFISYIDRILFLCDEISKIMIGKYYFDLPESLLKKSKFSNLTIQNYIKQKKLNSTNLLEYNRLKKKELSEFLFLKSPISKEKNKNDLKNFLLKKISKLIQIKKEFNLVSYTLDDIIILTKKDLESLLISNIKTEKNLKVLKLIFLTDELMFPRLSSMMFQKHNIYKSLYSSSIEVNTINGLGFCLKMNLGYTFLFHNTMLKIIKNKIIFNF
jgi:hypothetical protein